MSDPFNSLISTSLVPVMNDVTRVAGGVRAARDATQDSRNVMAQQMYADTLGVYDRMDARMEQGRQFDALMRTRSDELAANREESAFARLNSNLEFNLKMAEQESKDRQLAFENTLKLQQHNFQQQIQTLQLRELTGRVAAQEFMAEAAGKRMSFSEYSDGGAFADDMENLYNSNPEATRVLMGTPEGAKFIEEYNSSVRAARMTSLSGVTQVDPNMIGEALNWETVNKNAVSGELGSGRLSADQRQARALLYDRARSSFTPEQIAEAAKEHEGLSRSELEIELIKAYADDQTGQPHWEKVKAELSSPDGEMRFKELYETGMLEPIKNRQQILELKLIEESQHKVMAERLADTGGRFLFDEAYADELESFKENIESARARVMSGGNPRAANALQGIVSVDTLHDAVMAQAERNHAVKRTWKDLAEFTGVPGAYRGARALLLGGQVESNWDYVDMVLTPITIIPGFGLGVRAGRVAAGAVIRGGARALGKAGLKAAAKRGASKASQGAVSQVFSGLAARKTAKATLVKAMSTKQAQKAAYESAKMQLQGARASVAGSRASLRTAGAAARGAYSKVDDATRAVSSAGQRASGSLAQADEALKLRGGLRPDSQWFDDVARAQLPVVEAEEVLRGAQTGFAAAKGATTPLRAKLAESVLGRETAKAGAKAAVGDLRRAIGGASRATADLGATRGGFTSLFRPNSRTIVGDAAGVAYYAQRALSVAGGPGIDYRGLERAKSDLDQAVEFLNAGNHSKAALANVVQNLALYRSAVAEYFPGEEIPVEVNETILNIRNIVPRSVVSKIQRMVRQEFGLGPAAAPAASHVRAAPNMSTFGGMAPAGGASGLPGFNADD